MNTLKTLPTALWVETIDWSKNYISQNLILVLSCRQGAVCVVMAALCACICGDASSVALVGASDSDADYHEREDDGSATCHGKDSDVLLRHILCTGYSWTHCRVREDVREEGGCRCEGKCLSVGRREGVRGGGWV